MPRRIGGAYFGPGELPLVILHDEDRRLLMRRPSSPSSSAECRLDVFATLKAVASTTFDAVLLADCDHGVVPSIPAGFASELQESAAMAADDQPSGAPSRIF